MRWKHALHQAASERLDASAAEAAATTAAAVDRGTATPEPAAAANAAAAKYLQGMTAALVPP